jgi:hypothetical protein
MTLAVLELLKAALTFGYFTEFKSDKKGETGKITLQYLFKMVFNMLRSGFDVSCDKENEYMEHKLKINV